MSSAEPPPMRMGRYVLQRRIGSGSFATVWLGYDEQLDSPVAIKVLADNWSGDEHVRRRFLEEGRYLRRVESPYVVSVYDAGELDDGRPYLVMSYADQGTLADVLDDRSGRGALGTAQALAVVREVGAGLEALHERRIVHRDVKPANVLFRSVAASDEVRAMLGDLGLGKAVDGSSRLTMIGGTPAFIAPEQAAGESPGPAADQYSLAALAYLLLTGRRPFDRASITDALQPVARAPVSSPQRPFPDAVEVVLGRALSFSPGDRYPRVTDFVVALEQAVAPALDLDAPTARIPIDPELTRPTARPTGSTAAGSTAATPTAAVPPVVAAPGPRRRRGVLLGLPLGALALVVGGAAGYAAHSVRERDVTVTSERGSLSVRVPAAWARARAVDGWRPPGSSGSSGADDALSVGTARSWTDVDSRAEGVFAGLLPGADLPDRLPQHPECERAGTPYRSGTGSRPSLTVVDAGCPGGVTVERVVRVTQGELLWVQIRSVSQATALAVLDSVATHGL